MESESWKLKKPEINSAKQDQCWKWETQMKIGKCKLSEIENGKWKFNRNWTEK